MLPMTLQFIIVMIASAINDRMQRRLDYVEEERRILRVVGQFAVNPVVALRTPSRKLPRARSQTGGRRALDVQGALCSLWPLRSPRSIAGGPANPQQPNVKLTHYHPSRAARRRQGRQEVVVHSRPASPARHRRQAAHPRRAPQVLPDRKARHDSRLVPPARGAEVRQLGGETRPAAQVQRRSPAGHQARCRKLPLGIHEDPGRPAHGAQDRNRADHGRQHPRRGWPRTGAGAGEISHLEAVHEGALGFSLWLRLLHRRDTRLDRDGSLHGVLCNRGQDTGGGDRWRRDESRREMDAADGAKPDRLGRRAAAKWDLPDPRPRSAVHGGIRRDPAGARL